MVKDKMNLIELEIIISFFLTLVLGAALAIVYTIDPIFQGLIKNLLPGGKKHFNLVVVGQSIQQYILVLGETILKTPIGLIRFDEDKVIKFSSSQNAKAGTGEKLKDLTEENWIFGRGLPSLFISRYSWTPIDIRGIAKGNFSLEHDKISPETVEMNLMGWINTKIKKAMTIASIMTTAAIVVSLLVVLYSSWRTGVLSDETSANFAALNGKVDTVNNKLQNSEVTIKPVAKVTQGPPAAGSVTSG